MTDIRALVVNTSVGRNGTSQAPAELRATPDGALYTAELGLSTGIEGRTFAAHMGQITTPLTTAVTTALSNTTPHAWVRVPDGTVIIPIYARITFEGSGATTQGEISIWIAQNDIGNGTSSAASSGIISLNTAAPVTSSCTARQLATAATTAPTNPLELTRFSVAAASAPNTSYEWDAETLGIYPVIRGAGSWAICIGGNAITYFAQMVWQEFTEVSLS